MIAVDETTLWTAVDALDMALDSLAETMDGDPDERDLFNTFSAARDVIMQQIKAGTDQ